MKYDYDFFAHKVPMSATLALLGKVNYSRWCPQWLPKYNFHYISAFNNPRDMIFISKHNVIGVGDSIDNISEHLRSKMAAIFKMAAVLAVENCCSP